MITFIFILCYLLFSYNKSLCHAIQHKCSHYQQLPSILTFVKLLLVFHLILLMMWKFFHCCESITGRTTITESKAEKSGDAAYTVKNLVFWVNMDLSMNVSFFVESYCSLIRLGYFGHSCAVATCCIVYTLYVTSSNVMATPLSMLYGWMHTSIGAGQGPLPSFCHSICTVVMYHYSMFLFCGSIRKYLCLR